MAVRYGFRQRGDGDDDDGIDLDEFLVRLTDDYLEHGDLDEAMDRLLREGFETADGERVEGLSALLERSRERRRELEQASDPTAELQRYRDWLQLIEATEEEALSGLLAEAERTDDERRQEVTRALVDERRLQRALMSDSLGERLASFRHYEFVSAAARDDFEALVSELERDVLDTYFEASRSLLGRPDAAELERTRAMMDALSTMLEQQRRGEPLDPSFDAFMAEFGDYFDDATSLDDVVRQMAERAAAAEAMFRSLTADQQAELRSLFDQVLGASDLQASMNRLLGNLRYATPDIDWQGAHRLRGPGRGGFADAADVARQLSELRAIEEFLGRSNAARALPEVDVDALRRHLGDDAARHVERLRRALRALEERGDLQRRDGHLTLSAAGVRRVGQHALKDLFRQLRHSPALGAHREASIARGGDREETSRPWQPGEPFALHLAQTLRNALTRQGPGTPLRLHADDFEVEEFEATRRAATVFAIDLSLSMAMRGNLVPAKKMVLALTQLIRSRYPRDFVAVIGFAATASEVRVEDVPALGVDYAYGTNLQHALALGRHLLRHERGERQIVIVTDGEPTAHLTDDGEPFFSWPPVAETLQRTMAEVLRCTNAGIVLNTFALDIERSQFPFVEQIARVNGGRLFYVDVDELGTYVLDDFVRHHRAS